MDNRHHHRHSIFFPLLLIIVGLLLFLGSLQGFQNYSWEWVLRLWPLIFIAAGLDSLYQWHRFVGAVVLIGVGVVFLLVNFGTLAISPWNVVLRFWPVLLVALGLDLIIGYRSGWSPVLGILTGLALMAGIYWLIVTTPGVSYPLHTQEFSLPLGNAESAEGTLNIAAGRLSVQGGTSANYLLEGSASVADKNPAVPTLTSQDGKAIFQLEDRGESASFYPFVATPDQLYWDISLNSGIPMDLSAQVAAGEAEFDLTKIDVGRLDVSVAVGTARVILPASGNVDVSLDLPVGEAIVEVPQGTPVVFELNTAITAINLPPDFRRDGNTAQSPAAVTAAQPMSVTIDQPVGVVIVRYTP
ncbi:MAG TPA: DUF5668 domain-containing protein [Longilinea sp.]|nr:DUF5668 domain-containing protein [Longilinea sp.]